MSLPSAGFFRVTCRPPAPPLPCLPVFFVYFAALAMPPWMVCRACPLRYIFLILVHVSLRVAPNPGCQTLPLKTTRTVADEDAPPSLVVALSHNYPSDGLTGMSDLKGRDRSVCNLLRLARKAASADALGRAEENRLLPPPPPPSSSSLSLSPPRGGTSGKRRRSEPSDDDDERISGSWKAGVADDGVRG